jgi:hypothetical protein
LIAFEVTVGLLVLSLDPPPGLFSGVCRDSRGAL